MENIFGKNLKLVRNELGLTQSEFAKPLGIKGGSISAIEKGKTIPSESVIQLIEIKYLINREWLRTGLGEKYLRRETVLTVDNLTVDLKSSEARVSETSDIDRHGSETVTAKFTGLDQDTLDLLKMTRQVLESDTEYASSLAANVRSFHRSVENERRLANHEKRIALLEKLKNNGEGYDGNDHPSGAAGGAIKGKRG